MVAGDAVGRCDPRSRSIHLWYGSSFFLAAPAEPRNPPNVLCLLKTPSAIESVAFRAGTGYRPRHVRDRLCLANFRILEIDDLKTVPHTPISHPLVERLIGSLRRELLDQVFFWNTVDLERKLRSLQLYYNHSRTHTSLDGNTPAERSGSVVTHPATLRNFTWEKHCGGLFELPVAA